MPITSLTSARDIIYARFKAGIDASAYAAVPVFYPDTVKTTPSPSNPYLTIRADHTFEGQRSLGEIGNRRFRVFGLVMVQIFTPYGKGQVEADLISGVVKGIFRGVSTGSDAITFRNTRVVDVGQSGAWLQTNVMSEFDYDEIA